MAIPWSTSSIGIETTDTIARIDATTSGTTAITKIIVGTILVWIIPFGAIGIILGNKIVITGQIRIAIIAGVTTSGTTTIGAPIGRRIGIEAAKIAKIVLETTTRAVAKAVVRVAPAT